MAVDLADVAHWNTQNGCVFVLATCLLGEVVAMIMCTCPCVDMSCVSILSRLLGCNCISGYQRMRAAVHLSVVCEDGHIKTLDAAHCRPSDVGANLHQTICLELFEFLHLRCSPSHPGACMKHLHACALLWHLMLHFRVRTRTCYDSCSALPVWWLRQLESLWLSRPPSNSPFGISA